MPSGLQTQFRAWRNRSSGVKVQAGQLEEATSSVVSDIKLLRKAVSEAAAHFFFSKSLHASHQGDSQTHRLSHCLTVSLWVLVFRRLW